MTNKYLRLVRPNAVIFITSLSLVGLFVLSGCRSSNEVVPSQPAQNVNTLETMPSASQTLPKISENAPESSSEFSGQILAGSASPLLDFNQADYEKALDSGKPILLYFYANWCPICKREVSSALYPAFDGFDRKGLVGFRVNYRDNETDEDEEKLARQYGVAYQHTKILLNNKELVTKAPDSWKLDRYLEEMDNLLGG